MAKKTQGEDRVECPNLDRIDLLQGQLAEKRAALVKSEEELEGLLAEMRAGDLEQLKSGIIFEARAELEFRSAALLTGITQAKEDIPLLETAIRQLEVLARPEIIGRLRVAMEESNEKAEKTLDSIIHHGNGLWDALRLELSQRESRNSVHRAAHDWLVQSGMTDPEATSAIHQGGVPFYLIKHRDRDLPFALKRLLDVAFSAPLVRLEGSGVKPPKLERENFIEPRAVKSVEEGQAA